jgi:hypothetical protein
MGIVMRATLRFVSGALTLISSCMSRAPGAQADYIGLFGDPMPPWSGFRNIVIKPGTKHVNVEGGEVINFIIGDKIFSWSFFVARSVSSFDLNQVAPPVLLDHQVIAYAVPDPQYWATTE